MDKTKNVGYLLLLISLAELINLYVRQTTFPLRMQLVQINLVETVRGSYCSDGLKRDQVDNSRCFAQWTFRAS